MPDRFLFFAEDLRNRQIQGQGATEPEINGHFFTGDFPIEGSTWNLKIGADPEDVPPAVFI